MHQRARVLFVFAAITFQLALAHSSALAADEAAFEPIFNGRDLSGWVVEETFMQQDKNDPVWSVQEDSVLHCRGKGFGFLRFDRKLCDFVLAGEIRLPAKGNSGVGIRTVPYRAVRQTRPSFAAYEVQLQDDGGKPADKHSSGSLYRYVAPTENPMKPAGEWNTFSIECVGPRIKIEINGRVVQDTDQTQIAEIKDKPLCGYVSLQNHGSTVDFRNVRLKTIKAGE